MKREDCTTINYLDGRYIIDTEPGGQFPSKKEMDEIRRLRIQKVRELEKLKQT